MPDEHVAAERDSGALETLPKFIVAIVASAEAPAPIEELLGSITPSGGIAYVIVQDPAPGARRLRGSTLSKHTRLPIREASGGTTLYGDAIYLLSPDRDLVVRKRRLHKFQAENQTNAHRSGTFLRSLAEDMGTRSIAVILSGFGSLGVDGLQAIKNAGGLTILQEERAQSEGTPQSAIDRGLSDFVLPPGKIVDQIIAHSRSGMSTSDSDPVFAKPGKVETLEVAAVDQVAQALKHATGHDFTSSTGATLGRQIEKRMRLNQIDDIQEYLSLVQGAHAEARQLAQALMTNATQFLRDPEAFKKLAELVFPQLLNHPARNGILRLWVSGCATGEEAYSLALALDDFLTAHSPSTSFKLFATDTDASALDKARHGAYPATAVKALAPESIDRHFVKSGSQLRVKRRIRERIVFAVHNALSDPPFTRIDLVACRHPRLNKEGILQPELLSCFHFALRDGGFLTLGSSKGIARRQEEFTAIDEQRTLFQTRKPSPKERADQQRTRHQASSPPILSSISGTREQSESEQSISLYAPLLRAKGQAAIVIDEGMRVTHIVGNANPFLRPPAARQSQEIVQLLSADLGAGLLNLLQAVQRQGIEEPTPLSRRGMKVDSLSPLTVKITLECVPLGADRRQYIACLATEEPSTTNDGGQDGGFTSDVPATGDIKSPELRLAETMDGPHAVIARLKASHDALRNANEELHSANQELREANVKHQRKIREQELLSRDMEHLLEISEIASIFLDRQLSILKYTPSMTSILPLGPQDVGRPVAHILHDLPSMNFSQVAEKVFASNAMVEEHLRGNKTSQWYRMRAVPHRDIEAQLKGVVISFVDISAIELARISLAESEERFQQIAENIREVFWIRSAENLDLVYLSPAFDEIWGRAASDVLGRPEAWLESIHPEDQHMAANEMRSNLIEGSIDIQYRILRPDGSVRWIHDSGFPIRDPAGQLIRVAGLAKDVTKEKNDEQLLRSAAESLDRLASRDPLTELDNRRGLERNLHLELERARRSGSSIAAVLIDCDDFKRVNDTFGHAVGDTVLQQLANTMQDGLRPTDCFARIGGDEFLALLPDIRVAEAVKLSERLRMAVADTPLSIGKQRVRITASFGVGMVPNDVVSLEEVLSLLHGALGRSKEKGKNVVAFGADDPLPGKGSSLIVRQLMQQEEYRVFKQSIRDISTGAICGYELLSRGPVGTFESPNDFFRIAIENNILSLVDLACLKSCLRAANHLKDAHSLHINLYPSTLIDTTEEGLSELFCDLPVPICVEISEQQFIGEPAYLKPRIDVLKKLGLKIAVDDVGFGRSSLESLVVLEPDIVKIDRTFVRGCSENASKARFLSRLVRVAQGLATEVVAEGIEEVGERDMLGQLGVKYAQGFFWDRPSPVSPAGNKDPQ